MADIKLTDVNKIYSGKVHVLKDINLDIKQGELIVFVGPSVAESRHCCGWSRVSRPLPVARWKSTMNLSTMCHPPSGGSQWCSSPMPSIRI